MSAPAVATTRPTRADRFRVMAAKLAGEIAYRRESGVAAQRMTRRRAGMADHARHEADRMERVKLALEGMAGAMEAGTLPALLSNVSSKAQVEDIVNREQYPSGAWGQDIRGRLGKAMLDDMNFAAARAALLSLTPAANPADARKAKIAAMERALIGRKIPSFFPTPPAMVARLIELAEIGPGMTVLEPSAGKGDIADAIRDRHPDAKLFVGEINTELREILRAKGYHPEDTSNDFLILRPEGNQVDRVLQNPPFERGQDIEHVQHAYALLKSGGRLVSVMSTGPFTRDDRKYLEFRLWFVSVGGRRIDIERGAFAAGDKATGIATGVSSCIVVIHKA